MDITELIHAIRRRWWLVLLGVIVGTVAAYLVTFKPGTLTYSQPAQYSSTSTIFVTQAGFPWGRTTLPTAALPGTQGGVSSTGTVASSDPNAPDFADPTRFLGLAIVYSSIIQSDQVLNLIPQHYRTGTVTALAESVGSGGSASPLPLVQVTATGTTAQAAHDLDAQTVLAFQKYLLREQRANGIASKSRVTVTTLNTPSLGTETSGPGYLPGIAALLIAVVATLLVTRKLNQRTWEPFDEGVLMPAPSKQHEAPQPGIASVGELAQAIRSERVFATKRRAV